VQQLVLLALLLYFEFWYNRKRRGETGAISEEETLPISIQTTKVAGLCSISSSVGPVKLICSPLPLRLRIPRDEDRTRRRRRKPKPRKMGRTRGRKKAPAPIPSSANDASAVDSASQTWFIIINYFVVP
jgi:hypothetical protein